MRDDFDLTPALEVERELQRLSVELTHPYPRECLICYVYRMLEFGCTGLRWALHYRDTVAPRATALPDRLLSRGAGCDCEIFMNGYQPRAQYLVVVDAESGERDYPETMPPCTGVRSGSTQPCGVWQIRRGLWDI